VLLLPGESLAKYSSRHDAGVPEDALVSEAEPHAALETGQAVWLSTDEETEEGEITAVDRADEAQPDSPLSAEALTAGAGRAADESVALELAADIPEEADMAALEPAEDTTEEFESVLGQIEDLDDEAVSTIEETTDLSASEADDDAIGLSEDEESGTEEQLEATEDVAGSAQDDEEALETLPGEVRAGAPQSASVRDSNERYQHRVSRRSRRRRGGDRGERERAAQVEAPAAAPLEVRAPKVESRERPMPSITDLLREGQEIIVQIAKEPLGQKGARITSHIALPGRYVVFMPTLEHVGVSRKIASDDERQRLKRILQTHRTGMSGGFIVRTAGEGKSEDDIAGDMAYLYNLWLDLRQKAEKRRAPCLLHHDLDIVQRILRDQLSDNFKAIWCDNEDVYETVLHFMQRFNPPMVGKVKLYTRQAPIFDAFSITGEIEKALRPKVWLKSGGYIVVNQTEALVAIDVNTGKYIGKSNRLEDTITKTNTEAVKEIVRQIRLRDLGGIIVIDFIDMDERKNRQKVMQALEEAMRADRAPYKILQFNDFGLVAITRKRVKQSLERALCNPCPVCEGAGYTKSIQTVISEMLQEAIKIRSQVEGKNVVLRCYPDVAKYLKSSKNTNLEEIEEVLGRSIVVVSDPLLHPEKFDLAW
jgi:ribonuclease G